MTPAVVVSQPMEQLTMQHRLPVPLMATLVAALLALCAAADPVHVRIAGAPVILEPPPQLREGILEGSPAAFAGPLGCRFMSEADGRLLIISPDGSHLTAGPGTDHIEIDGTQTAVPGGLRLVEGHVVCALRPVLEALGCVVRWDAGARTLDVDASVRDIRVRADEDGAQVEVLTSIPVQGSLEHVAAPERWYVDLKGAWVNLPHEVTYVNLANLRRVRWAQFSQDPPVTRVVADLKASGEATWEPRPDGRGGSIILGRVDGDEPPVERPMPSIVGLSAAQPSDDLTRLRVELTDPVDATYDVLAKPPRVVIEIAGATLVTEVEPVPVAGPFVERAELAGEPGEPGALLILHLRQLIQFEVRRSDDPPAVEIAFFRESLRDQRVVIDPGHGGRDSGAVGRRLKEKDLNLDVSRRVVAQLNEIGAQTVLTRESDVFVDLYDRPAMANAIGADMFVSIHCNAMPRRDTGWGTETYYYTPQSKCLGLIVQDALVAGLGRRDNGLRRARFVVVRESEMPAVLVELMYLNHYEEENLLERPEVRQAAADAICEGLRQYVQGTGTPPPGEMGR